MNKDHVKGRVKEARGKTREVAGDVMNDRSLKHRGRAEQAACKVQKGYGDAKAGFSKNQ